MKELDIFDTSNSAAKYSYSIKVSTSNKEDKPIEEKKPDIPSEEVKGNFEVSTNDSASSGNSLNTALTIKALGNKAYDLSKLKVRYYFTSEGDIGARTAKKDWSSFDFTNDYSYKNAEGIVIYYDGKIVMV